MWDGASEAAWGSAAPATFWVALEQPGPWGHRALTQSRLDRRIGAAIEGRAAAAGGRALLIRSVGEHRATPNQPLKRRVLLSGGMSHGQPWLLTGVILDPGELLGLPWDTLAGPDSGPAQAALPVLAPSTTPVVLVCTNSKRDTCCAIRGRAVARAAAERRPGQVWECTHCGGHRFAATGIVLPSGHTLGRLTADLAANVLDAAAEDRMDPAQLSPVHNRGFSHLRPPAQAAEAFVRALIGEADVCALAVDIERPADSDDGEWLIGVRHRDGRFWSVAVREQTSPILRRNACSTDPVPTRSWQARLLSSRD